MELPQKLTTDLKIVQHQMKLEIQTHQIMRIKQANDPNNFKLHEDLREIEKRICSLGEKQNQLMRWLRKFITSIPCNSALIAKTIASSLGITINGTHPLGTNTNNISSNNKCISKSKKNSVHSSGKDQKQHVGLQTIPVNEKNRDDDLTDEISIKVESKDRLHEREINTTLKSIPENYSHQGKSGKYQISQKGNEICKKQTLTENKERLSETLTVEKERFLSAVGLVTREILKDLQNRRVERKRRSTANHTQFVYGSNWDISSKKRKKSNYLSSSAKQHVTRQAAAARTQSPRSETPIVSSKLNPIVSIFKTPLPVSNQTLNDDNVISTSISPQKPVVKALPVVPSVDSEPDTVSPPDVTSVVVYECKEVCFVCQKSDVNTFACACNINYHQLCAEIVENCVGCGETLVKSSIADTSGKKEEIAISGGRCTKENTTDS